MATEYTKTGLGKRLAIYRREAGFKNAQALAEHLLASFPNTQITRSTIVNLELGRKRDATIGEVMQLSKALNVPPAALLFDLDNPLEPYEDSTIGDISNVEALRLTGMDGVRDWDQSPTSPHFRKTDAVYRMLDVVTQMRNLALKWARRASTNDESLSPAVLIRGSMNGAAQEYDELAIELDDAEFEAGTALADFANTGELVADIPENFTEIPTKKDVLDDLGTSLLGGQDKTREILKRWLESSLDFRHQHGE